MDYRKPDFWTNLYSPWDIISGALDYYDLPGAPANSLRVQNVRDPAATVPLYAHVQYWTGATLANLLYANV